MENATKALIIAGAILVSILIISIGIVIVNAGMGVQDVATGKMDAQAIQAFNATFINYSGEQRGSSVKTLLQAIIANNAANKDTQVTVSGSFGTDPNTVMATVKATSRYTVIITTDPSSGLVTNAEIVQSSGAGTSGTSTGTGTSGTGTGTGTTNP